MSHLVNKEKVEASKSKTGCPHVGHSIEDWKTASKGKDIWVRPVCKSCGSPYVRRRENDGWIHPPTEKVEAPKPKKPVLYIPKLWTGTLNLKENTTSEKRSSKPKLPKHKSGRRKQRKRKRG